MLESNTGTLVMEKWYNGMTLGCKILFKQTVAPIMVSGAVVNQSSAISIWKCKSGFYGHHPAKCSDF